jgi:hypothetical protein
MSRNPGFVDCEEYSSRGLEVRTRAASKTRKQNKADALAAVLDEQENQISEGVIRPERIGKAYRKISSVSQMVAEFVAMRHRETVEEYLNEEAMIELFHKQMRDDFVRALYNFEAITANLIRVVNNVITRLYTINQKLDFLALVF